MISSYSKMECSCHVKAEPKLRAWMDIKLETWFCGLWGPWPWVELRNWKQSLTSSTWPRNWERLQYAGPIWGWKDGESSKREASYKVKEILKATGWDEATDAGKLYRAAKTPNSIIAYQFNMYTLSYQFYPQPWKFDCQEQHGQTHRVKRQQNQFLFHVENVLFSAWKPGKRMQRKDCAPRQAFPGWCIIYCGEVGRRWETEGVGVGVLDIPQG